MKAHCDPVTRIVVDTVPIPERGLAATPFRYFVRSIFGEKEGAA